MKHVFTIVIFIYLFFQFFRVISSFQTRKAQESTFFSSKCNTTFYFICIYSLLFHVFVDTLEIVLNIWYRIWSIRQFKFFMPGWSGYCKFIVFEWFLIERHFYRFFLNLFCLKDRVIVYEFRFFTIFGIHKTVFILYYTFIQFIILSYTFLIISFARYKEYMIWWI